MYTYGDYRKTLNVGRLHKQMDRSHYCHMDSLCHKPSRGQDLCCWTLVNLCDTCSWATTVA